MLAALLSTASATEPAVCNEHERCDADSLDPTVLSLSPRRGPTQGGQQLKVEGLRLTMVTGIWIKLGKTKLPCERLRHMADNMVQCVTPAAPEEGEGQVLLTHRCAAAPERQVCRTSRLRYGYEAVRLHSVTPTGGPPGGGTRLELRGKAFDLNQVTLGVQVRLSCAGPLGPSVAAASDGAAPSAAQVGGLACTQVRLESAEVMTCATPPLRGADAAQAGTPLPVQLQLSTTDKVRPGCHHRHRHHRHRRLH